MPLDGLRKESDEVAGLVELTGSGHGPTIHLKRSLAGLSYDEQLAAVRPPDSPVQMSADGAFRSATSGSGGEVPYRADMERSFGELTHVVQERRAGSSGGAQRSASVAPVDSSAEREAEALAPRAAAGHQVQVKAAPGGTYHRSTGGGGGATVDL